ncbi:hypothetical protein ACLOJK_033918 [Asimina triloba]
MRLRFSSSPQTPCLIPPPNLVAQLPSYPFHAHHSSWNRGRRASSSSYFVHAVEKESQFEIDREKAREALQKLDEQIQTLSQRPDSPIKTKKRPPPPPLDPNFERQLMTGLRPEEMPEMSGSNLAFSVLGLLILTFFYNAVFYTFIKPSVDGNEAVYTTSKREPMNLDATKAAPTISDQEVISKNRDIDRRELIWKASAIPKQRILR